MDHAHDLRRIMFKIQKQTKGFYICNICLVLQGEKYKKAKGKLLSISLFMTDWDPHNCNWQAISFFQDLDDYEKKFN